jgi:signal transduction histidine kinase
VTAGNSALATILTRRIAFFAVLAMFVQLMVVFSDYYWNDGELSRLFVEQETARLADGVSGSGASLTFALPEELTSRYGAASTDYIARVWTTDGRTLFTSCDNACEEHFLPPDVRPPDFWLRTIRPGKPLTLVGGRAFLVRGQTIVVDVATIGDPDGVVYDVLWKEVLDHMVVPMSILLVLVLGGTLLSVRRALRPVQAAAIAAESIDPLDARSHLSLEGMPLEIAQLAEAVNGAFERVGELMRSQKILTSGIAHEIRTPLAAIKLERARIDHSRARKAEADLDELVRFVAQMTALARLDSFDHGTFRDVDLAVISTEVVEQLAPWVYENGHVLELGLKTDSVVVPALEGLLKDAIRNLVENAVKHTPARTTITVRLKPGLLQIEDLNADIDRVISVGQPASGRSDGFGIGLKIVQRIAALHGASFTQRQTGHGRIAQIEFTQTHHAQIPPSS